MDRAANLLAALYLIVIIGVYMENNNKLSVTPLTDDEVKKFNDEVDHVLCSPIRKSLKDVLDIILITIKSFYRSIPLSDSRLADLSPDDLINSTTKAVAAAMSRIDEMDVTELKKIAEHSNYVYTAFNLVESYIPDGVLPRNYQPLGMYDSSPRSRYLRKILDICRIICSPTIMYAGSDIGFSCAIYLKSKLVEYPGGKTLCGSLCIPGDTGYIMFDNRPVVQNPEHPAIISTLKEWADKNIDDSCRDKFFAFLMRHEADIFKYAKVKIPHTLAESYDACVFFYRWFLKEQEQASK